MTDHILVVLMITLSALMFTCGLSAAQTTPISTQRGCCHDCNLPNVPRCAATKNPVPIGGKDDTGAVTAKQAQTVLYGDSLMVGGFQLGGQSMERVEIPVNGPELLICYDKDGKIILTVYRDGHVVTADTKKLDEMSEFFWREFAKYYLAEVGRCLGGGTKP